MLSQRSPDGLFKSQYNDYHRQMAAAELLVAAEKLEQAIQVYDTIVNTEIFKYIPEAYLARARLYLKQGNYSKALDNCEIVINIAPQVLDTYKILASLSVKIATAKKLPGTTYPKNLSELADPKKLSEITATVQRTKNELMQVRIWYHRRLRENLASSANYANLDIPLLKEDALTLSKENLDKSKTNNSCEYFYYACKACEINSFAIAAFYFEKAYAAFPYDFMSLFHLAYLSFIAITRFTKSEDIKPNLSHCLKQMNYIIEEFGYARAYGLRGVFYCTQRKSSLALPDFVEALKNYEAEDLVFYNRYQEYIFTTLEKDNKKIRLIKTQIDEDQSRRISLSHEKTADKHFDNKDYQQALLYLSLAIWYEDDRSEVTNYRLSHLYTIRAHVHLILDDVKKANHDLFYAGRFHENMQDFIRECSLNNIDRLITHVLDKLQRTPRVTPARFIPYLHLIKAAELFFATEFPQLGVEIINRAAHQFPHLPDAYAERYKYFMQLGEYEYGLEETSNALSICPFNTVYLLNRIACSQQLGHQELSRSDTDKLNTYSNKRNYFAKWYASELTNKQAPAPSEEQISLSFLGMEAFDDKRFDLAIFLFSKVLELNTGDYVSQTYRGMANILNLNAADGIKDYEPGIKKEYSMAYFGRALLLYSQKEMTEARENFNKAFATDSPADFDVFISNEPVIISCFKDSVDASKNKAERKLFYTLAMDNFKKGNHFETAKQYFSRVIWLGNSKSLHLAYFYRSYCYLNLGMPNKAHVDASNAIGYATRNQVSGEEIIKLQELFAKYCLTPVANVATQVVNKLSYYNLGIQIFPTKELLRARANFHRENNNPEAAVLDLHQEIALKSKENDKLYDIKETADEKDSPPVDEPAAEIKKKKKKKSNSKPKLQTKPFTPKKVRAPLFTPADPVSTEEKPAPTPVELAVKPVAVVEPVTADITVTDIVTAFPKLPENNTADDAAAIIEPSKPTPPSTSKPTTKSASRNNKKHQRRLAARTKYSTTPEVAAAVTIKPALKTTPNTVPETTPTPQKGISEVTAIVTETSTPTTTPCTQTNDQSTVETPAEFTISILTDALTLTKQADDNDPSSNQSSPLVSPKIHEDLPDTTLNRADSTDGESELDGSLSPFSYSSASSVSLNSNDVMDLADKQPEVVVKSVEQLQGEITTTNTMPNEAENITPSASNVTPFRLKHTANFFPEPLQISAEMLIKYMPKKCGFYPIEQEFINQITKLEQDLANNGITNSDGTPLYFDTYIVGGSLTDRVLKQFAANLRTIPNPPLALLNYLNQDFFKRELIVDDHDILTRLPLAYTSRIAITMGLTQLIREENPNPETEGYAPKVDFLSFLMKQDTANSVKVDFVHKPIINIAQEARERDSGLFLDREGNLIDISDHGLMDLVLGQVRLTILPTEQYLIEPLKLMHTIHTSTKRYLAIYDRETIKQCNWVSDQIQASYLNSALRKLFFPGRLLRNYQLLHEFRLFEFLYSLRMSESMKADAAWILSHLENSNQQRYPSLQHIHAIFIVSYTMQHLIGNPNFIYFNTSLADAELQNANIINACYHVINALAIFRDVYANIKPETTAGILETYINSWKAQKKDLIASWLHPVQAPPLYEINHQQQAAISQPCSPVQQQTPPPVYSNSKAPIATVHAQQAITQPEIHRSQTAPLIFNRRLKQHPVTSDKRNCADNRQTVNRRSGN